jgi:ABC-type polysaccharide/polyol phosphate transport system ATPase subunit
MREVIAIQAEHVSKKYCRGLKHTMLYGIQDIARNVVGFTSPSNRLRDGEFWALDDTSFEVKKGETLGIIGANGSGKSTLLKLLNGIFLPDKGRIEIKGRVGALIEVGAGFHPLLTGRENVYINGAILGMSKSEIAKKFGEIIDFADIGDFIDTPVKHYSSGMFVRLGFAVAAYCEPDILLIDEVLAVGDMAFQAKCFDKISNMKGNGITIVLVSHNMIMVQQYSDEVLLLNEGRLYRKGETMEVISSFKDLMNEQYVKASRVENPYLVDRFGSGEAEIIEANLLDEAGKAVDAVYSGRKYVFNISIVFREDVINPNVGFMLSSPSNNILYTTYSSLRGQKLGSFRKAQKVEIGFPFEANLLGGVYHLTPAISCPHGLNFFDYRNRFFTFRVVDSGLAEGIVDLNATINIKV